MNRVRSLLILALLLGAQLPGYVLAQSRDMWEAYAEHTGLFTPHVNFCSSSEVFIAIGGGALGFCMDKNQSSAAQWEDAKDTCAAAGKRLPEPAEFKFACDSPPTGLTNMTGDWEWASNRTTLFFDGTYYSVSVPIMGVDVCGRSTYDAVAAHVASYTGPTHPYRCVR